jgi:hypothetical protein
VFNRSNAGYPLLVIDVDNSLQDCFVRTLRDGGLVRVRIDLFSAHALSEFVVDMTPTTNSATGTDIKRDAAGILYFSILKQHTF